MSQSSKVEMFWQDYLATLSEEDRKNVPAYLVDDFADTLEAATKVGNMSVVVDGNDDPFCIMEMVDAEIRPFNTVDEQFAFEYGEGDRTRAYWLSDNWDFHSRWRHEIGREPSETMPIVFQRFRLLNTQGNNHPKE